MHTTVVFTGGPPPSDALVGAARAALATTVPGGASLAVAADGGLHLAQAVGHRVDAVVGDLDSVDPVALEAAVAAGATVDRHPVDKDLTDLELALGVAESAVPAGVPGRVVVLGDPGGRLDHLLAGVAVLASPRWAALQLEAHLGPDRVVPVRGRRTLRGSAGDVVTLLAVGGPAVGVVTDGLKWALAGATLEPGEGRGVSNELVQPEATVAVADGCVVAVLPGGGPS